MAVSTFFPDADPETTSVDGYVRKNSSDTTFANQRNGAGDEASDSSNVGAAALYHGAGSNYYYMTRGVVLFDTSSIPDGNVIESATLSLWGFDVVSTLAGGAVCTVSAAPASNTALATPDYAIANFGSTELAPRIGAASWLTGQYNDLVLNASGLAAISQTGVTGFGFRTGWDLENSAPSGSDGQAFQVRWRSAEYLSGAQAPQLVVTHSPPSLSVQEGTTYRVRTTPAASTKGANYILTGVGGVAAVPSKYTVLAPAPAETKGLEYRLPAPVILKTAIYAITQPRLSGIIKDRRGTTINCATYNVRINVYPVNNTASPPVATQLVTASNGAWTITGLSSATKYLVTFEHEGAYTPLGDKDIADAAFMTSAL